MEAGLRLERSPLPNSEMDERIVVFATCPAPCPTVVRFHCTPRLVVVPPKRFSSYSYTCWSGRDTWAGAGRILLVVPAADSEAVRARLPRNRTWTLAAVGGKTVYVNQPPSPGQPLRVSAKQG